MVVKDAWLYFTSRGYCTYTCIDHLKYSQQQDYMRYQTRRSALSGIVQGLLITRHMLFIGFSLRDDNFHRIADVLFKL